MLLEAARRRYTTKAYDPSRTIPPAQLEELLELLRLAPSSINSQPWHFVVAADAAGRARVAKSMQGSNGYNAPKVTDASAAIVLCARLELTSQWLDVVLDQEERDGRFATPEAKAGRRVGCQRFIDLHRFEQKDTQGWMEKQVYIALGALLLGAGALGIDATPMEGFDANALDAELGLHEQGYTSLVVVSLGYHDAKDFNAKLPKSRLSAGTVITRL